MTAGLAGHYDAKYGAERAGADARVVAVRAHPADRFEACLHYFPRHFRGGDILELGAGSGLLARSLGAAGVPFDSYTASEFSEARAEGLRRNLADARIRVAQLDAEQPAPDHEGRYDAVILLALVEHFVDPLRALQRVAALLRPGGFAYVDTPNIAKFTRRLKLLAGCFPGTATREEGLRTYDGRPVDLHEEGHLHYFTYRSLSRLLVERCGFARVDRAPYASPPLPLGRRIHHALARARPELFAELALVAWKAAPGTAPPPASDMKPTSPRLQA